MGLALGVLTCGPRHGSQAAAPALGAPSGLPSGPSSPRAGLELPRLDVAWTPPAFTAGDTEALAASLSRHAAVEVVFGPTLAAAEVKGAIAGLSPKTRIAGVRGAAQVGLVRDPAALQASREPGPGRPRYRAEGLRLQDAWLKRQEPGVTALVSVDAAPIDLAAWAALPAATVGSCEPALRALAQGQEAGLIQLEGFLNYADALLWRYYRAELATFVPEIEGELRRAAGAEEARECGETYQRYLRGYVACAGAEGPEACPHAPRVVLSAGGARIAASEPEVATSERCPVVVGRDVPRELRQLGLDAAEAAAGALDLGWSTLADRLGGLVEVHAALEDLCAPRRRRFAAADLDEARARLRRIGAALSSPELARPGARWEIEGADLYVPGAGPMRQLARFDPGPASINPSVAAEARALREFVLSQALCRSGHDPRPLSILVSDGSGGPPSFFGYLYREELACGALPPRVGEGV